MELLSSERAYASDLSLVRELHIPAARGHLPHTPGPPPPTPPASSGSSVVLDGATVQGTPAALRRRMLAKACVLAGGETPTFERLSALEQFARRVLGEPRRAAAWLEGKRA